MVDYSDRTSFSGQCPDSRFYGHVPKTQIDLNSQMSASPFHVDASKSYVGYPPATIVEARQTPTLFAPWGVTNDRRERSAGR